MHRFLLLLAITISAQQTSNFPWQDIGKRMGKNIAQSLLECETVEDVTLTKIVHALNQSLYTTDIKTVLYKKMTGQPLNEFEKWYYKVIIDKAFVFGIGFGCGFAFLIFLMLLAYLMMRKRCLSACCRAKD